MSEQSTPATDPNDQSSGKAKFIGEIQPPKARALLARRKQQPNDPEFVELAQAYNRSFYPAHPTNYRGCAPGQIEELEQLLASRAK